MKLIPMVLAGSLLATVASAQTATPPQTHTTAPASAIAPAEGNSNQAVATTHDNAKTPAKGANSFTRGEATRRLEKEGYSQVADLKKDADGIWRGRATKDNATVGVWLDYKGSVGQQ